MSTHPAADPFGQSDTLGGRANAFGEPDQPESGSFGRSSDFGLEEEEAPAEPKPDFDSFMEKLGSEDSGMAATPAAGLAAAPQIWTNPEGRFDRVVILGDEYLITANPDSARIPDIEETIAQGQVLRKQLGRTAQAVPLEKVTKVTANLNDEEMSLYYSAGKELRMASVWFASAETRNQVLEIIQEKLGPRFERTQKQYSRMRGMLAPLAVGFITLVMTALCYLAAADVHKNPQSIFDGQRTLQELIFGGVLFVVPPWAFLCIGGVLLLGALAWLATNLRTPPLMVTLAPKPKKK